MTYVIDRDDALRRRRRFAREANRRYSRGVHDPACLTCPIGAAAGVGRGAACPMAARKRPAGSCIHVEGEPVESVFYIKHGVVTLARDRDGAAVPHGLRRARSLLGLEGLVESEYRDSAHALTDVTVCSAPLERLRTFAEKPQGARALLEATLSAGKSDTPLRATTDGNAKARAARWLLDAAEPVIKLRRVTLAGLIGMQPETLSRALAVLVRAGAITVGRGRIEIRDRNVLRSVATGATAARKRAGA